MKCLLLSLFASLAAHVALPSSAMGEVIFAENFENTAAPLPAFPDSPQAGTWIVQSLYGKVVNSPAPGAHSGSNYFRLNRPANSEFVGVTTSTNGATTAGTQIHAEFWMHVVAGYASFGLNAGNGANNSLYVPLVSAHPDGTVVNYNAVTATDNPTGLTYTKDVWQKYELDVELGSSTVTLTLDGASTQLSSPFGLGGLSTVDAVHGIAFFPSNGQTVMYIDDILVETVEAGPASPADFNGDGEVDGSDLADWKIGFGKNGNAVHADGDADADLDVDGADFLIWQRELGFPATGGATSIPEPGSIVLATYLFAIALLRRRF